MWKETNAGTHPIQHLNSPRHKLNDNQITYAAVTRRNVPAHESHTQCSNNIGHAVGRIQCTADVLCADTAIHLGQLTCHVGMGPD